MTGGSNPITNTNPSWTPFAAHTAGDFFSLWVDGLGAFYGDSLEGCEDQFLSPDPFFDPPPPRQEKIDPVVKPFKVVSVLGKRSSLISSGEGIVNERDIKRFRTEARPVSLLGLNDVMREIEEGDASPFLRGKISQEAMEKVLLYADSHYEEMCQALNHFEIVLVKAAAVGKEKLPYSLLLQADTKGDREELYLFVLFNQNEVGTFATGASKKVKLALNLLPQPGQNSPWYARVIACSEIESDPDSSEFDEEEYDDFDVKALQDGYEVLQHLSGIRGVIQAIGPLFKRTSYKGKEAVHKRSYFLPFYNRGDLHDVRKNETNILSYSQKMEIARVLATALREMHDRGVVHGDIKPENILCSHQKDPETNEDRVEVAFTDIDQSLVNVKDDQLYPGFRDYGTDGYYAPEVVEIFPTIFTDEEGCDNMVTGSAVKKRDIYSLGVVLALLFDQKVTCPGRSEKVISPVELVHMFVEREGESDSETCERQSLAVQKMRGAVKNCFEVQEHWIKESDPCGRTSLLRDVIAPMLHPNPHKRSTAKEVVENLAKVSASSAYRRLDF